MNLRACTGNISKSLYIQLWPVLNAQIVLVENYVHMKQCIASEDLKHDAHLVKKFNEKTLEVLKERKKGCYS